MIKEIKIKLQGGFLEFVLKKAAYFFVMVECSSADTEMIYFCCSILKNILFYLKKVIELWSEICYNIV